MKFSKITYPDVNNGFGCRVTLFVSGCSHHCEGCFNKETWDSNFGYEFDDNYRDVLFSILNLSEIDGLTLSGGDPLFHASEILRLCKLVKSTFPNKTIWLYTGYTFNEIKLKFPEFMDIVDVIVDGEFINEQKDLSLPFRGSKNQHIWIKQDKWKLYD